MNVFSLYACCIPVKGAKLSVICDLQRNEYIYIPQGLYEILTLHKDKESQQIKNFYPIEVHKTIDEYFEYLVKNEWGFWNDESIAFPSIDLSYDRPEIINNAIIDNGKESNHDFQKYFKELELLGCRFIELRYYEEIHIDELENMLSFTVGYSFRNITLYIKYNKELSLKEIKVLLCKYPVVGVVYIHGAPVNKNYSDVVKRKLYYIKDIIKNSSCCGNIGIQNFSINIDTFTEAKKFNSCLNKKISIDVSGEIKNCPSIKKNFGLAQSVSLLDVAFSYEFQFLWNINKDQISVCKDCQFRYICTDCRAYLDNLYDKPFKCKYNPYEHTWLS